MTNDQRRDRRRTLELVIEKLVDEFETETEATVYEIKLVPPSKVGQKRPTITVIAAIKV